eukprot:9310798-Pyramimonas_sp.AAC.1
MQDADHQTAREMPDGGAAGRPLGLTRKVWGAGRTRKAGSNRGPDIDRPRGAEHLATRSVGAPTGGAPPGDARTERDGPS